MKQVKTEVDANLKGKIKNKGYDKIADGGLSTSAKKVGRETAGEINKEQDPIKAATRGPGFRDQLDNLNA